MPQLTLYGAYYHRGGWVQNVANWPRMITAHGTLLADLTDIEDYYSGTYNLRLKDKIDGPYPISIYTLNFQAYYDGIWVPPNDDIYRQAAHDVGVANGRTYANGADFLWLGNYVHPEVVVESINGYSFLAVAAVPTIWFLDLGGAAPECCAATPTIWTLNLEGATMGDFTLGGSYTFNVGTSNTATVQSALDATHPGKFVVSEGGTTGPWVCTNADGTVGDPSGYVSANTTDGNPTMYYSQNGEPALPCTFTIGGTTFTVGTSNTTTVQSAFDSDFPGYFVVSEGGTSGPWFCSNADGTVGDVPIGYISNNETCGNPTMTQIQAGSPAVPGESVKLYYAGSPTSFLLGPPGAIERHSLEIMSKLDLDELLGIAPGTIVPVVVSW